MDYTAPEILHFCLRWIYNFHEGDLQQAHATYSCGPDYHWNKYLGKRDREIEPTVAMTEVILNMDQEGQQLLIDWILAQQREEILEARQWEKLKTTPK